MITAKTALATYLGHARQNNLVQFYSQYTNVIHLPVCPKCERIAMRDLRAGEKRHEEYEPGDVRRTPVTCPHCGYHGFTTVSTKMYVEQKLYE
jgi:hypothetical protein